MRKQINFATASTSEKLEFLAYHIEGSLAEIFSQSIANRCIVGLGAAIDENGTLTESNLGSRYRFSVRYGVSEEEVRALWLANFGDLGIKMRNRNYDEFCALSPQTAARALRLLAQKYEASGN